MPYGHAERESAVSHGSLAPQPYLPFHLGAMILMSAVDRACPRCSRSIRLGSAVGFLNGDVAHLACWARQTRANAIELRERLRRSVTRTQRLVDEARGLIERPRELRQGGPHESTRVVVVEGYADSRDVFSLLLGMLGYAVDSAADAAGGLDRILGTQPQTALIDLALPHSGGFDLARRVRSDAACASIRLVGLSTYGGGDEWARTMDAGFDAALLKPIELDDLRDVLAVRQLEPVR